MHITVIGTGYVGLVSGTCFAELGFQVTCADSDPGKIDRLKLGIIPIYEPGLEALVHQNVAAGRLHFTTDTATAVAQAGVVFIAVGTPPKTGSGEADLTFVFQAAEEIARAIEQYTVVVTKSTVPVGTGAQVAEIIRVTNPGADFDVVSNPEFLREGCAIDDFMKPDRVVIGAASDRALEMMSLLYRPLLLNNVPVVFTGIETAELIKYAANSFLATKVAFINEMADVAECVGADIQEISWALGLDKRIGNLFLNAGPGFGGSCFPKDMIALTNIARTCGTRAQIVETVVESNISRKTRMAEKIITACGGAVRGKTLAVLGVAFKPGTDDMRDAPSISILPKLLEAGANLRIYDPQAMENAKNLFTGEVSWCNDAYDAMEGADAAVIITEWNAFRSLDLARAKTVMKNPLLVDLRNIYSLREMQDAGFRYVSVGRKNI